jgi:hypothetical protein
MILETKTWYGGEDEGCKRERKLMGCYVEISVKA